MNLKYMKEDAVTQLRENMIDNIQYYQNGQDWVDSYLKNIIGMDSWYLESRISFKKIQLLMPSEEFSGPKTDAENAKRIHKSLINLTPSQAIDPRIWTYLTHITYKEYMVARWLNSQKKISRGTLDRYFASGNRGIIRNGIARLWWYGHLSYDKNRSNPYELTELLLSNQDIAAGLLERNLGNNKEWLINILDSIKKYKMVYPTLITKNNIKSLNKYLNFYGGIAILDCMDRENTDHLIEDWITKQGIEKLEPIAQLI